MDNVNFQTPVDVCDYMASLMVDGAKIVLEPTKGAGNLVSAIRKRDSSYEITTPDNFFDLDLDTVYFDYVVMNPPFTPMKLGYEIFDKCMEISDNIIALMPWLTIINSTKRTKKIMDYGLISITHLPRNVFKGSRVQTCILNMSKGLKCETHFKAY